MADRRDLLRKDNNDDKPDAGTPASQEIQGGLLKSNNSGQSDARRVTGEYEYVDKDGRMGRR